MRKETLGAALFFCGFGIFISFCDPLDSSWIIRLIVSVLLMLIGEISELLNTIKELFGL